MDEIKKQRILVVDDSKDNIQVLMELLKNEYKIVAATSGPKALSMAEQHPQPDLILLDIMMSEMDGYEVCRRLKAQAATSKIPVIFVSAVTGQDDEYKGLELGAVDYLPKPVVPSLTKIRIRNHLRLKHYQDDLLTQVSRKARQLELTQSVMIECLGTLAEYRDPETGGHIKRTQNYVKALAKKLQDQPHFQNELTDEIIEILYISAPLHDIGKVGVTDAILFKPGKLTSEEFEAMKLHTRYGFEALEKAEISLGTDSFIRYAKEIAYSHHEKWDGSGYPLGLRERNIPVSGRLMALADVYDALISKRVYKPPFTHEKAVAIITEGKGTHFDPDMVDAFLTVESTFRNIALLYADFDEEREALGDKIGTRTEHRREKISTILIVEDNEINLEVMHAQLEHMGFTVDSAHNGKEALKKFQEGDYDLILTDLDMPIMDGYELVQIIRKQDVSIPVIAITATNFDMAKKEAIGLGFTDFLLKPFDERRIRVVLDQLADDNKQPFL